jgi:hypothetical protein
MLLASGSLAVHYGRSVNGSAKGSADGSDRGKCHFGTVWTVGICWGIGLSWW